MSHVRRTGEETLKTLSKQLTEKYGKGFSKRNLEQMRYFYLTYAPSITQTVSAQFTQESKNVLLNTPEQISTTVSSKSAAAEKTLQIVPYQKEILEEWDLLIILPVHIFHLIGYNQATVVITVHSNLHIKQQLLLLLSLIFSVS